MCKYVLFECPSWQTQASISPRFSTAMFVFVFTWLMYVACSLTWSMGWVMTFLFTLWFMRILYRDNARSNLQFVARCCSAIVIASMGTIFIIYIKHEPRSRDSIRAIVLSSVAGSMLGFLSAILYMGAYYDQNQFTGKRVWPALRQSCLWSICHKYFCLKICFEDRGVIVNALRMPCKGKTHTLIFGYPPPCNPPPPPVRGETIASLFC